MIENPKEIQKYLVKNQEKNNLRSELFKQIGKDGTTGQSKIISFFQNGAEYFDLGFAIFLPIQWSELLSNMLNLSMSFYAFFECGDQF